MQILSCSYNSTFVFFFFFRLHLKNLSSALDKDKYNNKVSGNIQAPPCPFPSLFGAHENTFLPFSDSAPPSFPHRDLTNMLGRRLPAQLERNLTTSDLATVKCLQARQAGTLLAPVWMGGVGGNSSQRNFFLFWTPNRVFSVSFCMSRCEQANVRARCIAYREMDWSKQIGMGFRVFDTARLQIFSLELV